MTREEAIRCLSVHSSTNGSGLCTDEQHYEAKKMAIKALEQEPCEDMISRKDAIYLADELKHDLPDDDRLADMVMAHNEGILEYQTQLSLLSSVNPQPKTGKWIEERTYMECPNCHDIWHYEENQTGRFKFCPTCGMRIK